MQDSLQKNYKVVLPLLFVHVTIERLSVPTADRPFEIVERKGKGHPDTICDAVAEEVSVLLSRYYLEHFGRIFHHNVDKVTLIAGKSAPSFGGGVVLDPMRIIIVGRATTEVEGNKIPIHSIVAEAVHNVFSEFHAVEEGHYTYENAIGEGSIDLKSIVEAEGAPLANDTSVGVGHAPRTSTERIVLGIEEVLNAPEYKETHPEVGEDVKVMGVRVGNTLRITVAAAFVGKYVQSIDEYVEKKAEVLEDISKFVEKHWDGEFTVAINAADSFDTGSIYITVTGLSAENGDDGAVGRGNRQSGFIPATKPVSLEAVAGKNPTSHVGKIYNVVADLVAEDLVAEGADEAHVFIVSKIGSPITSPQFVGVRIVGELPATTVEKIVSDRLEEIPEMIRGFVERKYRLF